MLFINNFLYFLFFFFSYCNAVSLVDLFRYSNMYVCTTKIGQLARNKSRYEEVIEAISRPSLLLITYFFLNIKFMLIYIIIIVYYF